MKLVDLKEEIIYEDEEFTLIAILRERVLQLVAKPSPPEVIGKLGIKKAGALGSLALDQIKRYKKLKAANHRTLALYARNAQQRNALKKVVDKLVKSKEYKIVRTFPYANGARMWNLKPVKVKK